MSEELTVSNSRPLKLCPFCGKGDFIILTEHEPVIGSHGLMHRSSIYCFVCEIEFIPNKVMPFTTSNMVHELKQRWNKRVNNE